MLSFETYNILYKVIFTAVLEILKEMCILDIFKGIKSLKRACKRSTGLNCEWAVNTVLYMCQLDNDTYQIDLESVLIYKMLYKGFPL